MKWLLDPSEYPFPNPRIDGWKKLLEVKARSVDIFVFPLEVFDYYLKNEKLPAGFIKALTKQSEKIIEDFPSHAAVVRRAFVVPGLENPPGPRLLGLTTPDHVVKAVEQLYSFAIKQKYHVNQPNQISGWLEPPSLLLDIDQYRKDSSQVQIPYGGYAVSENGHVQIYAVYGINEGVQSLVADSYQVEARRGKFFVNQKDIPQKNLMLCTTKQKSTQKYQVPTDLQLDQVLGDNEILEVARVVYQLSQLYGPQRVEFSTYDQGICFNEVADYYRKESKSTKDLEISGEVVTIANLKDLKQLSKIDPQQLESGQKIILVDEQVISSRNYDVLGTLAHWKDKLYILYPGVAATQHAMRILADKGHRAFLVGSQKFNPGDQVQITNRGGKVRVINLSKTENQKTVSLWDASLIGVDLCGGKATRLSQAKTAGFQVPHGYVCTTLVFDEILKLLHIKSLSVDHFDKYFHKITPDNQAITAIIGPLLPDYRQGDRVYSVRSSSTIEDTSQHSLAGIFDSFLNVNTQQITPKIIEVIRSSFHPRAAKYLQHHPELVSKLKMAVIIQEMVQAKYAGVIFGAKIQTGEHYIVQIEAGQGLGEQVVSGSAKKVEYISFNRQEKQLVEHRGPQYLSLAQARALFMLSERLRSEFADIPQDIEWAIDQDDQIWLLQSRDLLLTGKQPDVNNKK